MMLGTAEKEGESALSGPPPTPPTLYHSHFVLDARCSAVLQTEAIGCLFPGSEQAGRSCSIIQTGQEVDGYFSIMLTSLLIFGVFGVLLVPVQCDPISVCYENDDNLRVDCLIEPRPNKIASYEFSWSSGTKEIIINTNVSGSSADRQFLRKTQVTELEPHGYRLVLKDIVNTLPHNTTYLCKMSDVVARVNVEKSQLLPCSAVSVLLRSSCSWIACVLLFFYYMRS